MQCCPDQTIPFNSSTTDIPYIGQYGEKPMVTVLYLINGQWIAAGVNTNIQLQGSPVNNIHIDHGGNAYGLVRLS